MKALLELDELSQLFRIAAQGEALDAMLSRPPAEGGEAVPLPPNHQPDTEAGEALVKIWRDNYTAGVGFERAVIGNGTFMWPRVLGLFQRYPRASVADILPAARVALREYFAASLSLRPVVSREPIGNKLYACKFRISRNPGDTIRRWLEDPSMAPIIDAPADSLIEDLRNVSADPDAVCVRGVEYQGLAAHEALQEDPRLYAVDESAAALATEVVW